MIQRRREYGKREPLKDAHKLYIVCEGEGTEPNYFGFFEGLSSNLKVVTIPPKEGTDPLKLMERAKQVLIGEEREYTVEYEHGDTVWFVIDTDKWEEQGKIVPLREFCSQQNASISNALDEVKTYQAWNVAQSNPSFEIWLYYCFETNLAPEIQKLRYVTRAKRSQRLKNLNNKLIRGGTDPRKAFDNTPIGIANSNLHYRTGRYKIPCLFATSFHLMMEQIIAFVNERGRSFAEYQEAKRKQIEVFLAKK